MALKIRSTTRPELIGDIKPGWSIQENTTPHAIGDTSSSVGGVSFSARRRADSEFLLNKNVTVYYEGDNQVGGTGNNVSGYFDSVNASSTDVSVTSTNALSALSVEKNMPPVTGGVPLTPAYRQAAGMSPSIASAGQIQTDSSGNIYQVATVPQNIIFRYKPDGTYSGISIGGDNAIRNAGFVVTPTGELYASGPNGSVFRYSINGDYVSTIDYSAQSSNQVYGIALHQSGDILLALASEVLRFNPGGTFVSRFGSSGTGNGQFSSFIASIAADSLGNIFTVDGTQGTPRVQKFNSSGVYQTQWAVPTGLVNALISVDPSNNVYVLGTNGSASTTYKVAKYNNAGALQTTFIPNTDTTGGTFAAGGIDASSGAVVVRGNASTSSAGYKILKYTTAGAFVSEFVIGQNNPEAIIQSSGMTYFNNKFYVSDVYYRKVNVYDERGGGYLYSFGGAASVATPGLFTSAIWSPTNDSAGNIYVLERATRTVHVFSETGTFLRSFTKASGTATNSWNAVVAIKIGEDGFLYSLEFSGASGATFGRVQKFTTDGTYVSSFGAYGTDAASFNDSRQLDIDANGLVYVYNSTAIKRYNNAGTFQLSYPISQVNGSSGYIDIAVDVKGVYVTTSTGGVYYFDFATGRSAASPSFGGSVGTRPAGISTYSGKVAAQFSDTAAIGRELSYSPTLNAAFDFYIQSVMPQTILYSGTSPQVLFPGWSDMTWAKLNELCAAYSKEIAVVNDQLVIRDVDTQVLTLDNFAPSPTANLGGDKASRHITIVSQNATQLVSAPIFDYTSDQSRTISAGVNEYSVTNIQTNTWLTSIQPVTPALGRVGIYPAEGQYFITSADDRFITPALWNQYGGAVNVYRSDDGTSVDVAVTGPGQPIADYQTPYTISTLIGNGKSTGISIIGSGVKVAPQALKVATGADWSKVSEDVGQTVNNPFITSPAIAYDRAPWACTVANGLSQTISLSIPLDQIGGLGLVAGSTFIYRNCRWRIIGTTVGNISIGINAARYTTVGNHDALYSGQTIGAHDTRLTLLTLGDSAIKPLY